MHITEETHDPATRGFGDALSRAKGEFLEMPGLKLTVAQARRLWAVDAQLCDAVLTALVESRFLVKTRDAAFTRNA